MAKKKKKVDFKTTPAYLQGKKDAYLLLKTGLSIWFISNIAAMQRKHPTLSNKNLFHYCEGFNDRLAKAAKEKGFEAKEHGAYGLAFFSQEDIGKEHG